MEPETGALIALASHPHYDLNLFTRGISKEEWDKLQNSPTHPFLNRALQAYPPGSIFKIITTIAASETLSSLKGRTFFSRGFLNVSGHVFHDWNRQGFGAVNIYQALAN